MRQLFIAAEPGPDQHVGESVGYLCPHCHAHDETLKQVVHEDGCPLVGEHGRNHYESVPDVPDRFSAAIQPEHAFTIIRSNETDRSAEIYNGTVVAFRCEFCGIATRRLARSSPTRTAPLLVRRE